MATPDIESRITSTRAQLESTLNELEDKFNVPKRVEEVTDRVRASVDRNPVPWIIGAVAAAVGVVAIVAWAILSDDD